MGRKITVAAAMPALATVAFGEAGERSGTAFMQQERSRENCETERERWQVSDAGGQQRC